MKANTIKEPNKTTDPEMGRVPESNNALDSESPNSTSAPPAQAETDDTESQNSVSPFKKLDETRAVFSGKTKKEIFPEGSEAEYAMESIAKEKVEGKADSAAECVAEKTEEAIGGIGGAVVGKIIINGYNLIKEIIENAKSKKDAKEEEAAKDKGLWAKFKEKVSEHKDKLMDIIGAVAEKIPFVRTLWNAFKMVVDIVDFFHQNSTRKRMADNRRKFKENSENGAYLKNKSTMGKIKKFIGVAKHDKTVDQEKLSADYDDMSADKQKETRQFMIDDRMMKMAKSRQIEKGKSAMSNGLNTLIKGMKDFGIVASMGIGGIADIIDTGKSLTGSAAKAAKSAMKKIPEAFGDAKEAKSKFDDTKEAMETAGLMLEHIGSLNPLSNETEGEFEPVENNLDASGVDKKKFYQNTGKPENQKKMLVKSLMK